MTTPLLPDPDPSGLPIITLATAPKQRVLSNLPDTVHPRFVDEMFPVLWATAVEYGVDPVGMVAQSGKETGWGNFGGRVEPWFQNTAGIKVRHITFVMDLLGTEDVDHPLVHAQFPNWTVGAMAQAQHLRAYAGRPVIGLIVDPRYTLVGPPFVSTWAGLGGRWAPSDTYGLEIERIMADLSEPTIGAGSGEP